VGDPVSTCHSVVLRDSLGRKNALFQYLILYFTSLHLQCCVMVCAVQHRQHAVAGSTRAETVAAHHSAVDGELQRQNAAFAAGLCG